MKLIKEILILAAFAFLGFVAYQVYVILRATNRKADDALDAVTNAAGQWTPGGIISTVSKGLNDGISAVSDFVYQNTPEVVKAADNFSGVSSIAADLYDIPALQATSQGLDNQISAMNNRDYAPGGRIYNNILNSKGQQAADTAWQQVQQNDLTMRLTTSQAWDIWN